MVGRCEGQEAPGNGKGPKGFAQEATRGTLESNILLGQPGQIMPRTLLQKGKAKRLNLTEVGRSNASVTDVRRQMMPHTIPQKGKAKRLDIIEVGRSKASVIVRCRLQVPRLHQLVFWKMVGRSSSPST